MSEKAIYTKAEVDKLLKQTYQMGMEEAQKKNTDEPVKAKKILNINIYDDHKNDVIVSAHGEKEINFLINGLGNAIAYVLNIFNKEDREIISNTLIENIKINLKMMGDK